MLARLTFADVVVLFIAVLFIIAGFVTIVQPEELRLVHRAFPPGLAQKPLIFFQLISPSLLRVYGLVSLLAGFGLGVALLWLSRKR